jgi:hypothetical protein
MSELVLMNKTNEFLLDYENHHNRIKEDFDRVFDHNISIELVYKYVLEEEK